VTAARQQLKGLFIAHELIWTSVTNTCTATGVFTAHELTVHALDVLVSLQPIKSHAGARDRCGFSLIARFLTSVFHKVVWQHTQGVVRGFLITTL